MPRYVEAGERAVRLFSPAMAQSPSGYASTLAALADLVTPPTWIILAGELLVTAEWKRALQRRYRADVRVIDLAVVASPPLELLKGTAPKRGATAWLCTGTTCLPPIADLAGIERALEVARAD